MGWTVEYFQAEDGTIPAAAFEDSISAKLKAKMHVTLEVVAETEGKIGGGRFEKCHTYPDLWEARSRLGKDLGRHFCTRDGDRLVILSGIVKPNGTATPASALEEANRYLSEYQEKKRVAQ